MARSRLFNYELEIGLSGNFKVLKFGVDGAILMLIVDYVLWSNDILKCSNHHNKVKETLAYSPPG